MSLNYGELTYWQGGEIKLKEETNIHCPLGWWYYLQIKDLFLTDKKRSGFKRKLSGLDQCLTGETNKLISKLYKICLKDYTHNEAVKTQMVRWAENFNKPIMMQEWEYFWERTYKITGCTRLQKNSIKMFYRWHITPEIIVKMSKK